MADDDRDDADADADAERGVPDDAVPADAEPAETEPEPDEPERVTPEVVSGVPPADAPPRIPGPTEKVVLYRMVRIGITVLMLVGALTILLGVTTAVNPDSVVCATARSNISDELDADDPNPAVSGLTDDEVDDMSCNDAVALAQQLDDELIEESTARGLGIGAAVVGAIMVGGGIAALLMRNRRGRMIALVAAGIGLLASTAQLGLGFISLLMLGFVFFALMYSRDAKASYGDPRAGRPAAGGLFRPRVPPPSKD
jgi:hypothetical protein